MTFAYENGSQTSTDTEKPWRDRRTRVEESATPVALRPPRKNDVASDQEKRQGLDVNEGGASEEPRTRYHRRRQRYFSAFFSVLFSLVLVGQGSRVPVASARDYRQHQLASGGQNHHHPFPSSNAAPSFPRQFSHPEVPKVSRSRKSVVAGSGQAKSSSTSAEPASSSSTAAREPEEPDARLSINAWLSIDSLKNYNYTSLRRYDGVCPLMVHSVRGRIPPSVPTEVSAASSSSSESQREPLSLLQCLPLDENALNVMCSEGAPPPPPSCTRPVVYGPPSAAQIGDSNGGDLWENVHLKFCSHYNLAALMPNFTLEKFRSNKTLCESTLRNLMTWDNTSRHLDCEFDTVIARYDCKTGYSVNSNCSSCKKAYRKWVCAMMLPYHAEGRRVKACRSFCHLVEKRCPYFHPFIKEQYAGEPAFKCIDRNIPDLPTLTPNSAYGPDDDCYDDCEMASPLEPADPVLNCRQKVTAKMGRVESGLNRDGLANRAKKLDAGDDGADNGAVAAFSSTTTSRVSANTFKQPDTKTERYRTGTRPTGKPPAEGRGRDPGGGFLVPTLPPDQSVSVYHSTGRGPASSSTVDRGGLTASSTALTDATPGASPTISAATSTYTTYLLLEPWILAISGAVASLVTTFLLGSHGGPQPPPSRTSADTTKAGYSNRLAGTRPQTRRRRRIRLRHLVTD